MQKVWLKNYPKGVPHEINTDSYASVNELFEEACRKFSDRSAFVNMGAAISFSELDQLATDFASFLQNHVGLKKGDRIALQMPNVLQFPVALFGALRAGLIVVNTNPLYTAREMQHQFKDSGAKAIVILANFAHNLEQVLDQTDIKTVVVTELGDMLGWPKSWVVNGVVKHIKKMVPAYQLPQALSFFEALDLGRKSMVRPVDVTGDDLAFLQYTGGTTGVSKGAMLTHRNMVANMLQVSEWIKILLQEGQETVVTALPLYHIFSLTANCLSLMRFGSTNVLITNPKDIPGFIKTLRKTQFTIFTGVNTLYNALMNHPDFTKIDFSLLKCSVAGGMALQKAVAQRWKDLTQSPLVEGYGLTESSPVVCVNPIDGTDRPGTIGLPVSSTHIKVIDEDGKDLGLDQEGELCVLGPQVMKGYWQRPDETALVIDNEGWLRTGDVAVIDQDGFVRIVDRKKDMILVSGFNVYPNEIEDVVATHQKVLEAAVIGVPDEHSGEAVKLFVVRKDLSLSKDELKTFCQQNLVAYKVPKHIEFRDELPKTNVGKILRRALRT